MPHSRAPHSEDDGYEARGGASGLMRFLTGLIAFAGGVFICGACGSYSPTDPSLNSAVGGDAENLFGRPGALLADLLTQGFGWTAWLMGFALMIGGLRRTLGIGQRDPAAWMWGGGAIVLAACCLAEWPIPKTWVLSAGLGGVVGDVLLTIASTPFAALKIPDATVWASALSGVGAILFSSLAMGLGASDGASLWRALTAKPERRQAEPQQYQAAIPDLTPKAASGAGVGAVFGAIGALFGKKQEVIEPIVVTDIEDFEDGERGFLNAVEN